MGEQRTVYPLRRYAMARDTATGKRKYYPVVQGKVILSDEYPTAHEATARAVDYMVRLDKEEAERAEPD